MTIIEELRNHWADRVLSELKDNHSFMTHPVVVQLLQGGEVKQIASDCNVSDTTVRHYRDKMLRIGLSMINPYHRNLNEFSNNFNDYQLTCRSTNIIEEQLKANSVITLSHIPIEEIAELKIPARNKEEILTLRKSIPDNLVSISDIEAFRKFELALANARLNNKTQITIDL